MQIDPYERFKLFLDLKEKMTQDAKKASEDISVSEEPKAKPVENKKGIKIYAAPEGKVYLKGSLEDDKKL